MAPEACRSSVKITLRVRRSGGDARKDEPVQREGTCTSEERPEQEPPGDGVEDGPAQPCYGALTVKPKSPRTVCPSCPMPLQATV